MSVVIREMSIADYEEVLALWRTAEGVGLSAADARKSIEAFLHRNLGLSFVARGNGELVGAVLCGHDGRRGYIHHLAVNQTHRRQGIGSALVERCIAGLNQLGIGKCHLFVFAENESAIAFWQRTGWERRHELVIMSNYTATNPAQ